MEQFKIAKWGNSLAIRLPSKMVKRLGLKDGDVVPAGLILGSSAIRARLEAERKAQMMTRDEGAKAIRQRWKTPASLSPEDWKIDHNDPDARG